MSGSPLVSVRFPYLPLTIRVQSFTTTVFALVDTGFDGEIVLPLALRPANIVPDGHFTWTLADGTTVRTPTYDGTAQLGRFGPLAVAISTLGDEPLVGRRVTNRFAVTLDHGQRVIVAP